MFSPLHSASDYDSLTDKALWEAFRKGDRYAFSFIYKQYLTELFNYGCKIVPDRDLVKDHLQELFVTLWNTRNNLSPTDNIRFYLFKALRRSLIHEVSKQKKYFADTDVKSLEHVNILLPFENQLISNETDAHKKKQLHTAINRLSDRQKEVITLLFYESYTYEQISELMTINLRSVYTLAWKALNVLRKELLP